MNIKKNIIKSLAVIGCMALASMAHAWYGRVVPVAYNQQKQEWSILLGLNNNGYWNDFGAAPTSKSDRANKIAQEALNKQTNGQYNISIQGNSPWYKFNDDYVHFVKVPFISGADLYKNARNGIKEDFRWVSENELVAGIDRLETRVRGGTKEINISGGFLHYFKQYWPQARTRLDQTISGQTASRNTTTTTSTTISQSQSSAGKWFKIPRAIYFYESGKPYYEFTNFQTGYSINLDGKQWPTTEHYYQAMKFRDTNLQEQIRNTPRARQVFDLARTHDAQKRSDWQRISLECMLKALRAKFSQHPFLKTMLLKTGDKTLVEDAKANDAFFGAGADYNGENHLGRLLMHVRAELSGLISANTPYASGPWA